MRAYSEIPSVVEALVDHPRPVNKDGLRGMDRNIWKMVSNNKPTEAKKFEEY